MKAIIQTGYQGAISAEVSDIPEDKFLPSSLEVTTTLVPLLPYDIYKLRGEVPVSLPSIPGYGAVGIITKVGGIRSKKLLNERVLVLNPSGTFKSKIVASIPLLTIKIPEQVTDEQAAAVVGGLDTALTLSKKIMASSAENIILTGANSVIGLALLQLLKGSTKTIYPIVSEKSQEYFESRQLEYGLPVYPVVSKGKLENTLVIDIAGQKKILERYLTQNIDILSIALQNTHGVHFISEFVFPGEYTKMFSWLQNGDIVLPIDHVFSYNDVRGAIDYQSENHSRGRNLITFEMER